MLDEDFLADVAHCVEHGAAQSHQIADHAMSARRVLRVVDDHDCEADEAEQDGEVVAKREFGMEEDERNHHCGWNTHSIAQHDAENGRVLVGLYNEAVSCRVNNGNNQVFPPSGLDGKGITKIP